MVHIMAPFVQVHHTAVIHEYAIKSATYHAQDAVGASSHPAHQGSALWHNKISTIIPLHPTTSYSFFPTTTRISTIVKPSAAINPSQTQIKHQKASVNLKSGRISYPQ